MHLVITGGTGLIGRHLIEALLRDGHTITLLTRSPTCAEQLFQGKTRNVPWPEIHDNDPWPNHIAAADGVVHLAGATLNRRWSPEYKQEIRRSRVEPTRALTSAMIEASDRPRVLVSGSAIGFYGPGDDWVDENSPKGNDFLADVVHAWESEAARAQDAGIRTVYLRTGLVLSEDGGALARMVLPFRLFVGGPLGSGDQWLSWIHRDDLIGLIRTILEREDIAGPVNGTAPHPVRMREFARTLGRVMHRPARFRVPGALLRLVLGEMADLVLTGQRVRPAAALRMGYTYRFEHLEPALQDLLAK